MLVQNYFGLSIFLFFNCDLLRFRLEKKARLIKFVGDFFL